MYIATNLGAQISDETFGKKYLFGPNSPKKNGLSSTKSGFLRFPHRWTLLRPLLWNRWFLLASQRQTLLGWGPRTHRFPRKLAKDFAMVAMTPLEKVATTRQGKQKGRLWQCIWRHVMFCLCQKPITNHLEPGRDCRFSTQLSHFRHLLCGT